MERRDFIRYGGLGAAGALLLKTGSIGAQEGGAHEHGQHPAETPASPPALRARGLMPVIAPGGTRAVITPNGESLRLQTRGRLKIGHLIAEPIEHEFAPGLRVNCWGYNGRTTGPTIEVIEGDRVRFYVTNRLPEPTSLHWHGILLPSGMDGVSGLTQRAIQPGETFKYEFTFTRPGTFMYHPHYDEMTQMAMGMVGMIVVHPRTPRGPRVDRDFVLMTHEWKVQVGTRRPDPNAMMDFNVVTFNSKAYPGTEPLVVGRGERVRLRFGNLSPMDHHPVHLHGYYFKVTATDGGYIPEAAQWPETTVLVPTGSTRTVEFVADAPGDWAMHCHMTHHIMNQMGHGTPVTIGADAARIDQQVRQVLPDYMTMGHTGMGEMAAMGMRVPPNSIPMVGGQGPYGSIDMGGMFTILKVRDNPDAEDGSGWYENPPGTQAILATPTELAEDGIEL